jgi:predicted DNA binding protein
MILSVKTKGALPLKILLESEVILRPPIHVKGGIAKWNLIATHKKLRMLTLLMRMLGFSFKIKSIKEYEEEELLTARQKEVLKHALRHGYYDTPRGISLTDLAKKLDISKSTLWEILRAIEKKLLCYEHVREKR